MISLIQNNRKWTVAVAVMLVLVMSLALIGSASANSSIFGKSQDVYKGKTPKYVFLFIGDGLSFPQVSSAEMYLGNMNNKDNINTTMLNFSKFPTAGAAQTFDSSSFIPDSASTATSLASGHKTLSGVINMDETKTKTFTPITEKLKAKGYKIGIISSVPITHATPAAFYAKVPHRNNAYDIGKQLASSGFDFFGGGSFQQPTGPNRDQEHIFEVVKKSGYKIVDTKEGILSLNNKSGKVVAISPVLDGQAMPYEIDRKPGELALADFVRKGIEVLDNPKGFFMMVESGKIDWAGHANDAAASIHDTIAFAKAIDEALKVYEKYPNDTLIIVTGDHECGGMSIGFAGTAYETFFEKIEKVTMSHVGFNQILNQYKSKANKETAKLEDLFPEIKKAYGLITASDEMAKKYPEMVLTSSELARLEAAFKHTMRDRADRRYTEQERIMYDSYEPLTITLTHILNNKAGLHYSSFSHTGLPVPVYAIGAGNELFSGFYDNTDIYRKMAAITGVK